MKILLREQQVTDIINKYKDRAKSMDFSDIDVEKVAPSLSGLQKFMSANQDLNPDFGLGSFSDIVSPSGRISDTKAPYIPEGNEMMHPLGQKTTITSKFGYRNVSVGTKNHQGIDISASIGTPVYAPLDGYVVAARDTSPNRCGYFIQLEHANVSTKFCHLSKWVVKTGDNVKKGQIIGYTGNTGVTSGPHLHYEILNKNGIAMNPLKIQPNLA